MGARAQCAVPVGLCAEGGDGGYVLALVLTPHVFAASHPQLLQHWLLFCWDCSWRSTPRLRPAAPPRFWGSLLGNFFAIARKRSFTFIAVFAEVSINNKLLSSAYA